LFLNRARMTRILAVTNQKGGSKDHDKRQSRCGPRAVRDARAAGGSRSPGQRHYGKRSEGTLEQDLQVRLDGDDDFRDACEDVLANSGGYDQIQRYLRRWTSTFMPPRS